jgi:hypothetical protein
VGGCGAKQGASEQACPSLCGRPEKARRWNGETILPRSPEPYRLFNITEARSSKHVHRYSLEQSVGPGRLIRTDAAHDSHQIDNMAGLSGCRVATRREMSLIPTLNTKSHRTHHAMLHVEAVEMACVKLSRQNCLPAGLQEALIKPYSTGAAGCECMLIAVPQT